MEVNEVERTDLEQIVEVINFYRNLYQEAEAWRPEFQFQNGVTITNEEHLLMQRSFEEEVLDCVKCVQMTRPQALMNSPWVFSQSYWEIVKEDVMKAVQNFHSVGYFGKSFNATYVAFQESYAIKHCDRRPDHAFA